ncbi:MAG: hypothetical protein AAF772_18000 [Acidobacteriota bacterium]
MQADDLIDRYVHDVTRRLPWSMRADVASELRSLLAEHEDKDTAAPADVVDRLIHFGAPAEVAARYHAPSSIIDPLDSRRFGQFVAAALLMVVVLHLSLGGTSAAGAAAVDTHEPSLFWDAIAPIVGVLTMAFWLLGVARRRLARRPFDPRRLAAVRDLDAASRLGAASAAVLGALGALTLAMPDRLLALVTGGRATPDALAAFTYDPVFWTARAPWVMVCLALGIALLIWTAIRGRWDATSRRVELGLHLATSLVLLGAMQAGPIFTALPTDRAAKFAIALIVAFALLDAWWKWDRLQARRPLSS